MTHSFSFRFLLVGATLLVAGCSGLEVKESLGLKREAPDEFRVVARPPLSVPPEFHLAPPSKQARSNFSTKTDAVARSIVTDSASVSQGGGAYVTRGEATLLGLADTKAKDPLIREKLMQDTLIVEEEEPGWLDSLRGDDAEEPVIDASAEAQRLKENAQAGEPVTAGEVPIKDPKKRSTLERIFQ